MVCGRAFDSRALHHSPKANGSPLAFFFRDSAGLRGFLGFLGGSCNYGMNYRPYRLTIVSFVASIGM